MCSRCYQRWRLANTTTCSIKGCEKQVQANDLCGMHYQRMRTKGSVGDDVLLRVRRYETGTVCSVKGCDDAVVARGLCSMHWQRLKNNGDPLVVRQGGQPISSDSYRAVHRWMDRNFPKTGTCEECGLSARPTDYARRDHSRCTRDRADWRELCRFCHRAFDKGLHQ